MESVNFTKMHSAGNDYIYINALEHKLGNLPELAKKVSHRRYGIGSDGLVILTKGESTEYKIKMYNADGSESNMCGNALICIAKYIYEKLNNTDPKILLELGTKTYPLKVILNSQGRVDVVEVQMGQVDLTMQGFIDPELAPSTNYQKGWIEQNFTFKDKTIKASLVAFGNPHLVIFVDDLKKHNLAEWASLVTASPIFLKGINLELVQVLSKNEVIQKTWERGSGETWACGSGACAVCVAGLLSGKTEQSILVNLLGGQLDLKAQLNQERKVFLKGKPVEICSGELLI